MKQLRTTLAILLSATMMINSFVPSLAATDGFVMQEEVVAEESISRNDFTPELSDSFSQGETGDTISENQTETDNGELPLAGIESSESEESIVYPDPHLGGRNIHLPESMGENDEDYPDIEESGFSASDEESRPALLGADPFDVNAFDYTKNRTYVEMLIEAARVTGMSPFVMAAMIRQEMGDGTSPLVTGAGINGKYKGIYNMINYQAYADGAMSARERGLWWANGEGSSATSYGRPWNSPERSIFRGMAIMAWNYLYYGQENYYFKKFNVNPDSWSHDNHWSYSGGEFRIAHQYMSNLNGANGEGSILGKFYSESGFDTKQLTFHIPVYQNMPADPCPEPGKATASVSEYTKDVATDSAAQKIISDFGSYPGYKDLLLNLHEKHPSWTFVKVEIPASYQKGDGPVVDTTWAGILKGESLTNTNLVPRDWAAEWKKNDIERDSGGWVDASEAGVAYYLDPRNFLKDNDGVYQFLHHGYNSAVDTYMNAGNLTRMVQGSFLGNAVQRYVPEPTPEPDPTPVNPTGGGSGSGGGGGGGGKKKTTGAAGTFSEFWFQDAAQIWRVKDKSGKIVTNAWLCDNAVTANGKNVWYLLQADGSMLAAGLVQDNTGNFYSLETEHNGFYGMLRYQNGYYNCSGQKVYLEFEQSHNGSFAAVKNADGLAKLKQIYGVTPYKIGNENCRYTGMF